MAAAPVRAADVRSYPGRIPSHAGSVEGVNERMGVVMDDKTYQRESRKAVTMALTEPELADYRRDYRHGLRRSYLGDRRWDEGDHQLRLAGAESDDAVRAARGRGYLDALAV